MTEQLHTDQFNFNTSTKIFSAEASELGWKPGLIPMVIALTSARTGKVESFTLDFIEEDGSLRFEACNSLLRKRGINIQVFNDQENIVKNRKRRDIEEEMDRERRNDIIAMILMTPMLYVLVCLVMCL